MFEGVGWSMAKKSQKQLRQEWELQQLKARKKKRERQERLRKEWEAQQKKKKVSARITKIEAEVLPDKKPTIQEPKPRKIYKKTPTGEIIQKRVTQREYKQWKKEVGRAEVAKSAMLGLSFYARKVTDPIAKEVSKRGITAKYVGTTVARTALVGAPPPKYLSEFTTGVVRGVKEEPVKAGISFGLGFATPPVSRAIGAVGKAVVGAKGASTAGKIVGATVTSVYAGVTAKRVVEAPKGTRAELAGRIAGTEVLPYIAGFQTSEVLLKPSYRAVATGEARATFPKRGVERGDVVLRKGQVEGAMRVDIYKKGWAFGKEKLVSTKDVRLTPHEIMAVSKVKKGFGIAKGVEYRILKKGGKIETKGTLDYAVTGFRVKKDITKFRSVAIVDRKRGLVGVGRAKDVLKFTQEDVRTTVSSAFQITKGERYTPSGVRVITREKLGISPDKGFVSPTGLRTETATRVTTTTAGLSGVFKSIGRTLKPTSPMPSKPVLIPSLFKGKPVSAPTKPIARAEVTAKQIISPIETPAQTPSQVLAPISAPISRQRTRQRQRAIQRQTIMPLQAISGIQKQAISPIPLQGIGLGAVQSQLTRQRLLQRTATSTVTTGITFVPPTITFVPPGGGIPLMPPSFIFPSLRPYKKVKRKRKKMRRKYTPSLVAIIGGIRGVKPERLTGLEVRPKLK